MYSYFYENNFLFSYIMDNFNEYFSLWDINSITNFIKDNFIQIVMLLLVFVIIYVIDYINRVNALLYGLPTAIPGLPNQQNTLPISNIEKVVKKKNKHRNKVFRK